MISKQIEGMNQEIKGELFTLNLSDLKIIKTINKSTKELTTTPSLKEISKSQTTQPVS